MGLTGSVEAGVILGMFDRTVLTRGVLETIMT